MEKFIFLVIVFIIVTIVESFSTKKKDGGSGDEWDVSDFDFTRIKTTQRGGDVKTFEEVKRAEAPRDESERSAENEKYFEGVNSYIEQPLSQQGSYIDQPRSQADSYIEQPSAASAPVSAHDAYGTDASGRVVRHKNDCFEKSKTAVSADVDSQYALNLLNQLVASGAVVDRQTEKAAVERREAKSARKALKKMDSGAKSSMGSALVAQTGDEEAASEPLDVAGLFTGPNLKKSILASIILDKSKF